MMKTLVTFVWALVCVCHGHICLISPPQRGSMVGLNKPAAPDCILLQSPCGGRNQTTPGIALLNIGFTYGGHKAQQEDQKVRAEAASHHGDMKCCGIPDLMCTSAGQPFTVTVQKNLDHYIKATPGYFSLSIGTNADSMTELAHFTDTSDPSLTLYIQNVTIPGKSGHMIFQARYVTLNPQAPPVFYQCADVYVLDKHMKIAS